MFRVLYSIKKLEKKNIPVILLIMLYKGICFVSLSTSMKA